MGIEDLHILFSESDDEEILRRTHQARELLEAQRIREHHEGKHPWGSMRRDCPLCNPSK